MLIGFGTDRGTVAAASDWDGPMEVKKVIPARPDSYERVFRQAFVERSLTDWRSGQRANCAMFCRSPGSSAPLVLSIGQKRNSSAIISRRSSPTSSMPMSGSEQTGARVTPLAGGRPHGAPDTYPFGL